MWIQTRKKGVDISLNTPDWAKIIYYRKITFASPSLVYLARSAVPRSSHQILFYISSFEIGACSAHTAQSSLLYARKDSPRAATPCIIQHNAMRSCGDVKESNASCARSGWFATLDCHGIIHASTPFVVRRKVQGARLARHNLITTSPFGAGVEHFASITGDSQEKHHTSIKIMWRGL